MLPRDFRNERGATLVEHAIVLPIFMVLLIVVLDFLRISYNALTVQFVVANVIRQVSIGEMGNDSIQSAITRSAKKFGVPISTEQIALCPVSQYPCSAVVKPEANELVILQVQVPTNGLVFGNGLGQLSGGSFRLEGTALIRMEPFDE